jgi:hypothetical protein
VIAIGRQELVRCFNELATLELGWGAIDCQGEGGGATYVFERGHRRGLEYSLVGPDLAESHGRPW